MSDVQQKLVRARTRARMGFKYFGALLYRMRWTEVPDHGTMSVDAEGLVRVDPRWVGGLSTGEAAGALIHEVGHLVLQHGKRFESLMRYRTVSPTEARRLQWLWNVAADLEWNQAIREFCGSKHNRRTSEETGSESLLSLPEGALLPERFLLPKDQSAEFYFDHLCDMQPYELQRCMSHRMGRPLSALRPGQPQQPWDDDTSQVGQGRCGTCATKSEAPKRSSSETTTSKQRQQASSQPGQGCPEKQEQGTHSTPGQSGSTAQKQPTPPHREQPIPLTQGMSDVRRRMLDEVRAEVARGQGFVPDNIRRLAAEAQSTSEVRWQEVLRRHIRLNEAPISGRVDYTYRRPSRRGNPMGLILPAMCAPKPTVAIVADTSGSMSPADLAAVLRETRGCLRHADKVWFIPTDAEAHLCVQIRNVAKARDLMVGGGGTDMGVGLFAAGQKKPSLTVVVTDGLTDWPDVMPPGNRNVLIVRVNAAGRQCPTPPWARVVEVSPGSPSVGRSNDRWDDDPW